MKKAFLALSVLAAQIAFAGDDLSLRADRIAVDNVTQAAIATGNVEAVCGVVSIRGDVMERTADGLARFGESTCVTTCTNEIGHTHWNVSGAVEYKAKDYVIVRNAWLTFYELPVFYLPYFWYPLDTDCGFSWMPGWTSEWGVYLMTKYSYHLLGDSHHEDDSYWLKGATRFDLREEQGVALGQDLAWSLDGFGQGHFKVYYAWDRSDQYDSNGIYDEDYNYSNWGSSVPDNRYSLEFFHRWDPTERDAVRVKGSYFSDFAFRDDFFRDSLFSLANPFLGYDGNEVAWEHFENGWGAGISVSGPLNDFWGGTARMPEVYIDINPTPLFGTPINYESETRIGYMGRSAAEYGRYSRPFYPYAYNPGPWGDYDTFRFDTYHRLTAPFKTAHETLSIAPRLAYRGTYWNQSGGTDLTGFDIYNVGESGGEMFRSIPEVGVTFAARGTGWVNEKWQHMIEPYVDVLAQKAFYTGASGARRPYVFDNLDASVMWEDQFAGRARNLPYTYYGVTPGLRQAWDKLDADGSLRTVFDFDIYAALQFNSADLYDQAPWCRHPDLHSLAEAGSPNYGSDNLMVVPGVRARWMPDKDVSFLFNGEYDSENNRVAMANFAMKHRVSKTFNYYARYNLRDSRWWDYSSAPYMNGLNPLEANSFCHMESDDFNRVYFHLADAGFEVQPLDWFRFSPFLRWDIAEGELDRVGAWFDYLVDCIGFRLILAYKNAYTTIDGYEHRDHFNVGFVIYLRAMDDDATNIFTN